MHSPGHPLRESSAICQTEISFVETPMGCSVGEIGSIVQCKKSRIGWKGEEKRERETVKGSEGHSQTCVPS
eukprot:scaffold1887_cov239-Pinguiococcus_pyrenoidosus.AAC.2